MSHPDSQGAGFSLSSSGGLALLAMTATALAFWPVPVQLFELWMDSDRPYSHGLLVGPIAIGLVIRAFVRAGQPARARSWIAALLFAVGALVWVGAYATNVMTLQLVVLPALLVLAAAAFAGWSFARRLLFPIGFLYFAVPVWNVVTPLLQGLTVAVVSSVLDVAGLPVFVEDTFITIPEGVFEVAGGCAGLHFFIVALTLASLQAHLLLSSPVPRLLLVGIAATLALLTNWLRVGSLVVIGHLSDMQHYLITDEHYSYGWVLFALALAPMFVALKVLVRREDSAERESVGPSSIGKDPSVWRSGDSALVVLFAVVLFGSVMLVEARRGGTAYTVEVALPSGEGGWEATSPSTPEWAPEFPGASGEALGTYEFGAARVDVFVAVYRSQSQGSELIGDRNRLFHVEYRRVSARVVDVEGSAVAQINEQIAESNGRRRIVWYWYMLGRAIVVSEAQAKLLQVATSLWGDDSGAIVAVSAECSADCADSQVTLANFMRAMGDALSNQASVRQSAMAGGTSGAALPAGVR